MPDMKPDKAWLDADRQSTVQRIEEVERYLSALRDHLARLDQLAGAGAAGRSKGTLGIAHRYSKMTIVEAIVQYLKMVKGPRTRRQIAQELIDGDVRTGQDPEKNIFQSIGTNVGLGKLKEPGPDAGKPSSLIGLPDWPDELFQTHE